MKCYVINLDRSKDRFINCQASFSKTHLDLVRVSAVDGSQLRPPYDNVSVWRYSLFFGRRINPSILGCYFSHIKALKTFLETDDPYAVICEDDVMATSFVDKAIEKSLDYHHSWELLRLNALKKRFHFFPFADLNVCKIGRFFGWFPGTGAYLVNRSGAEKIIKNAYPAYLPYDYYLGQSSSFKIKTAVLMPFPIELHELSSQSLIVDGINYRYPALLRWSTVLPYRGFSEGIKWFCQIRDILHTKCHPPQKND